MVRMLLVSVMLVLPAMALTQEPAGRTVGLATGRPETPGITRTSEMDNVRAQAVRVRFERGAAEVIHRHDNDLILVALAAADIELTIGGHKTLHVEPGDTAFIPKQTDHQLVNRSDRAIEFIAISLK